MNAQELKKIKAVAERIASLAARIETELEDGQPLIDPHANVGIEEISDTHLVVASWFDMCAAFNKAQRYIESFANNMDMLTR